MSFLPEQGQIHLNTLNLAGSRGAGAPGNDVACTGPANAKLSSREMGLDWHGFIGLEVTQLHIRKRSPSTLIANHTCVPKRLQESYLQT